MDLARGNAVSAVQLLEAARKYESFGDFWPQYLRGLAYLKQNNGVLAEAEFRTILNHRGWYPVSPLYPLAQLGLARAAAMNGDGSAARKAYQDFLALWKDISSTFFAVMIAIASISLVVGGIVIMNIMLVSVTERTREIGVRKALGARRSDILLQFLIESSTISVIGGAIGVLCGVLVASVITWAFALPSSVQLWSVISGLIVALSVGLFFGTYPASKAAKLDPVEALRSE